MQKTTTLLMFTGRAEEAMKFYTSLFPNSEIKSVVKYGKEEGSKEGQVMQAIFTINGQEYMAMDSSVKHDYTFTPSISIFISCDNEDEIAQLYKKLSEHGEIRMPLDTYEFSKQYGWVSDKFGVSWQLNLA